MGLEANIHKILVFITLSKMAIMLPTVLDENFNTNAIICDAIATKMPINALDLFILAGMVSRQC